MALKRPPQHRADAIPVYVSWDLDDGWDKAGLEAEKAEVERINAERVAAAKDGEEPSLIDWNDHPVEQYKTGRTRYDLDAPIMWRGKQRMASEWVGSATRFRLRRLSWRNYYRVQSAIINGSGEDVSEGLILACKLGLAAIEGDTSFKVDEDAPERSESEMEALFAVSPGLLLAIGGAVWRASQPLTEAEKKA